MTPKNYNKDFVQNTIYVLNKNFESIKKQNLEVTFLINCLTGLIITTHEKIGTTKNTVFNMNLEELPNYNKLPSKRAYLNYNKGMTKLKDQLSKHNLLDLIGNLTIDFDISDCSDMRLIEFLNKIRNGIAHQHIEPIDHNGQWEGIKFWNIKDKVNNFDTIFTVEELKDLSIFIAEKYLQIN